MDFEMHFELERRSLHVCRTPAGLSDGVKTRKTLKKTAKLHKHVLQIQ